MESDFSSPNFTLGKYKIVVSNLGKCFEQEWVFKNFDFQFNQGTSYAIVGRNGSGKSTLMKILWGTLSQSNGTINYFFQNKKIDPHSIYKDFSIVAPYMNLIEEFTLKEMVQFHFKFKKKNHNDAENRLIRTMGFQDFFDKRIVHFSSGMKQKLKLGLAFYSNTSILFLDEPTVSLDNEAIIWYKNHLEQAIQSRLTIIASNQEREYLPCSKKIHLSNLK